MYHKILEEFWKVLEHFILEKLHMQVSKRVQYYFRICLGLLYWLASVEGLFFYGIQSRMAKNKCYYPQLKLFIDIQGRSKKQPNIFIIGKEKRKACLALLNSFSKQYIESMYAFATKEATVSNAMYVPYIFAWKQFIGK